MSSFPPPSRQPTVPVEPAPPPSPRRTGLWVGAGLVVVALIVGGIFLFKGDDKKSDDASPTSSVTDVTSESDVSIPAESAKAFALERVADTAKQTKAVQVAMSVDVGGQHLPIEATIDNEKQLMAMTMDMSLMVPGANKAEIIFDVGAKTMYMATAVLPAGERSGIPAGVDYLKMDLAELAKVSGENAALDQVFAQTNPLDVAPLFAQASDTTVVGDEEIDGEAVRHYVVKVATADVIAKNPQMKQAMEGAGQMMPEELTYDVWVTADNQLRRLTTTMDIAGQPMTMEMTAHALDQAPNIKVPDEAQTVDIMKLMDASQG